MKKDTTKLEWNYCVTRLMMIVFGLFYFVLNVCWLVELKFPDFSVDFKKSTFYSYYLKYDKFYGDV